MNRFVEDMRTSYEASVASMGNPDEVALIKDITLPEPHQQVTIRLYREAEATAQPLPILLFVHGGGWVSGSLATHDILCRRLARDNAVLVVAVDYSLAPECRFPGQLDELAAVVSWLQAEGEIYGGDSEMLYLIGDSAGGNLVAGYTLWHAAQRSEQIKGQILLYPGLSFLFKTASIEQLGQRFFPTKEVLVAARSAYLRNPLDAYHPFASPLEAEIHTLPPTLCLVGEFDPLRDECQAFHEKLQAAGQDSTFKLYPGVQHGFVQYFKQLENLVQGEAALKQIQQWLAKQLLKEGD